MGVDLRFRHGVPADASTISALASQVFLDTYAAEGIRPDLAAEVVDVYRIERFAERLAEPSRAFVLAERGTGLVGFAEIMVRSQRAPNTDIDGAELVRLYVQPKAQRLGLGGQLIDRAEQLATDAGLAALWLTAWVGNAQALAFYDARAYTLAGTTLYTFQGNSYVNNVLVKRLD
jgi:GNAT superfamily N-acetyltransferase